MSNPQSPIRIYFFGTPDFSIPALESLIQHPDIEILGVVTQPDKPAGRGNKLTPPPVKILAEKHQLPVYQPKSIKKDSELQETLAAEKPDYFVTIAFGQILSQAVLDIPQYGTVNVHASLLPELRGANPIQQAILEGKTETGLTTMLTDIGVDTGDILLKKSTPIDPDETAGELFERLSQLGGELLIETLKQHKAGLLTPTPQDHNASTHAPKCAKESGFIAVNQDSQTLHNLIRGLNPWPSATVQLEGDRIKLLKSRLIPDTLPADSLPAGSIISTQKDAITIKTKNGGLDILILQPPGKKPMNAADWARGALKDGSKTYQFKDLAP